MRNPNTARVTLFLCLVCLCLVSFCLSGCSPRDFLTRRLATDLISRSDAFREPQAFLLVTGVVSNKDFNSPESLVLQRRGWIIGTQTKKCPEGVDPPPCWDVQLTPIGVEAIRPLITNGEENQPLALRVARRKLLAITGISKAGNFADVEFTWQWEPLNPVGAALYDSGVHYRSTVQFRDYDDGWRLMSERARGSQTLEDALRNSEAMSP
jgi:hypothetical protein